MKYVFDLQKVGKNIQTTGYNGARTAVMPEPGGPGGPLAPPIFGRSVNPIPTGEGRLSPPTLVAPPMFFTFRHHWVTQRLPGKLLVKFRKKKNIYILKKMYLYFFSKFDPELGR